jgi:acetylornithine deacetylase/succinyl-diaminopimelate desuccinylase-like protein
MSEVRRVLISHRYNIIATTKTGDQNNVIMIGAHSDSVNAGGQAYKDKNSE